jgi:hypothetical protein
MTTQQPEWTMLANLGDVNPLNHGGVFVYTDATGVYPPEVEIIEPDDDDEPTSWTVHRFILEPCTLVNGVLSDNPFHPDHPAWFADGLQAVADSTDRGLSSLQAALCSEDIITRAFAYVDVARHFGLENFDEYPLTLDRTEANERYPQFSIGEVEPDTCDECGATLEVCCDGILRCLDCNPCPACHDGGMEDGPDEDDITTTDGLHFYQSGKLWLTVSDPEDAPAAIRAKMDAEGFFPAVWSISDHGNPIPFDLDREPTEDDQFIARPLPEGYTDYDLD